MSKKKSGKGTIAKAAPAKKPDVKADKKKAAAAAKPEKEAPKVSPEKTEIPKFEPVEIPKACEYAAKKVKVQDYNIFDGKVKACKECKEKYPDSANACEKNTLAFNAMKKATKPAGKRPPGFARAGKKTPFGCDENSAAGKIDMLLLSKTGATMEQLKAIRKSVGTHFTHLKKIGVVITKKGDHYFGALKKA